MQSIIVRCQNGEEAKRIAINCFGHVLQERAGGGYSKINRWSVASSYLQHMPAMEGVSLLQKFKKGCSYVNKLIWHVMLRKNMIYPYIII